MFAIAFDLIVAGTATGHPKGVAQAYADIGPCMARYGITRVQGSRSVTDSDNLAQLFQAKSVLKVLAWFFSCVRDIRAFMFEHWSDFTQVVKERP